MVIIENQTYSRKVLREKKKPCFVLVDLEKAFDRVLRAVVWWVLCKL